MTRSRTLLAVSLLALLGATGGAAQSLTSIRGLGYPMLPSDARAEALGGLGVGLMGLSVPLINPASAAGVIRRGVVVTAAATERTSTLGDVSASSGTTRFPLIQVLFPVGDVVFTAGYGTFLDQSWSVIRRGSEPLGTGSVDYEDIVESVGGIGQAQVGAAIPIGNRLAIGLAVGTYAGGQDVSIQRLYDTTSVGALRPYRESRGVHYGGLVTQLGFRYDAGRVLRIGGSVTWSGALSADSAAGPVATAEYDMPLKVAGGASAYLAPGLLAAVSGRWSGWSVTDPAGGVADPGVAVESRDTWEFGAGLELDNPERRTRRSYPLRLGFQYRELPFSFVSDSPTEWLGSLGVGIRFGADFNTPLARLDLTIQRGARSAAGGAGVPELDESFWRFALGLSIFGT